MSTIKNELLYEKALAAIKALFEDTSVDAHQAIDNLNTLADEIEDLVSALEGNV